MTLLKVGTASSDWAFNPKTLTAILETIQKFEQKLNVRVCALNGQFLPQRGDNSCHIDLSALVLRSPTLYASPTRLKPSYHNEQIFSSDRVTLHTVDIRRSAHARPAFGANELHLSPAPWSSGLIDLPAFSRFCGELDLDRASRLATATVGLQALKDTREAFLTQGQTPVVVHYKDLSNITAMVLGLRIAALYSFATDHGRLPSSPTELSTAWLPSAVSPFRDAILFSCGATDVDISDLRSCCYDIKQMRQRLKDACAEWEEIRPGSNVEIKDPRAWHEHVGLIQAPAEQLIQAVTDSILQQDWSTEGPVSALARRLMLDLRPCETEASSDHTEEFRL